MKQANALFVFFLLSVSSLAEQRTAYFAGGCFWCLEAPFDKVTGVTSTVSGYMGGKKPNPTYEEVSRGDSGYLEIIAVGYDSKQATFEQLLEVFFRQIDPLDDGGQFVDRGDQYRTAIFVSNKKEEAAATEFLKTKSASPKFKGKKIVTRVLPAPAFYPAEAKHQDFYKQNPDRYNQYYQNSGRPKK